ncbi:hypothetical protein FraEuI1c_0549 [Pseudofrankia inefficax]|uniref:Uncharacterized protein n=1 Tax=Pseudofrankia inefficax (strain DSM 45817 / CECT 9037 / DDB 130130 / EuI1c) TaxID=298654 RepID=E3JBA0_PSEI1|nr:hypothetical protein FraEuI1c_0549 [Pseudofrankia inefficax]
MPFDVRGNWQIVQTSGHIVDMNVPDENPDGTFDYGATAHEKLSGNGTLSDARASDSEAVFLISWSNGARGRYSGHFDFQGRLTGVCHDETHPSSVASWYAKRGNGDLFGPM